MLFLNVLNPAQREAVETVDGPVMIVAGAGSGKTRVLTYRIAYLLHTGVPPYQILALTFTNKAAEEMKARIAALVGNGAKELWVGTFHSVFARILRRECDHIGFGRNFSIYDTADSSNVIKRIMSALNLSRQQYDAHAIRSHISFAKNRLADAAAIQAQASNPFEAVCAKVFVSYQQELKSNNAMDFDDLLLNTIDLFRTRAHVLSKYQERFRFILVDEYQDTNHPQYVILKALASKHGNLCVVGDDAQSIYAFRGADIRNMLDFQRDYSSARVFRL